MKKSVALSQNQSMLPFIRTWFKSMQFGSEEVCLDQCLNSLKYVIVKLIMKSMGHLFVDTILFLEAVCDK